jgi:hypothetical protein
MGTKWSPPPEVPLKGIKIDPNHSDIVGWPANKAILVFVMRGGRIEIAKNGELEVTLPIGVMTKVSS